MKAFLIGIMGFCLIANPFAATIRVPQDYLTVNGAVQAAKSGDEVVISPGTYDGFGIDKELTVRSTFDGKDQNIIYNTRIKGSIFVSPTNGVVIRGLRISWDPVPPTPFYVLRMGIYSGGSVNATIEYCIIENCVHKPGLGGSSEPTRGAAITGINGLIRNNIIRNNYASYSSAMHNCWGLIQNNILYNDLGYDSVGNFTCQFINNTIYNCSGVGVTSNSKFINNILWHDSTTTATNPSEYGGVAPQNCVIKNYTGPGTNIITSDPKFIDPAHADFHLQASSPAIDAGITTLGVKADFAGIQRGLKGVSETRGDGSGMDIGAYEYKPKPVSVWLPNGGPDAINAGDTLTVAWELDVPPAGTAINLQLFNGSARVADFGFFWNANGAAESTIILPTNIPTRTTYTLRGISAWNPSLYFTAPLMTIFGKNAIPSGIWNAYL